MKFPIAIEPATENTAWGVVVPDLPGCFSAGDTPQDAFAKAHGATRSGFLAEAARAAMR